MVGTCYNWDKPTHLLTLLSAVLAPCWKVGLPAPVLHGIHQAYPVAPQLTVGHWKMRKARLPQHITRKTLPEATSHSYPHSYPLGYCASIQKSPSKRKLSINYPVLSHVLIFFMGFLVFSHHFSWFIHRFVAPRHSRSSTGSSATACCR